MAQVAGDGLLAPGVSLDVEFVIGLVAQASFDFFANAFGDIEQRRPSNFTIHVPIYTRLSAFADSRLIMCGRGV